MAPEAISRSRSGDTRGADGGGSGDHDGGGVPRGRGLGGVATAGAGDELPLPDGDRPPGRNAHRR